MFELLKHTFNSIVPINEKEWRIIKDAFQVINIAAKQHLTSIGAREESVYFLIKGIIRLYCINTKYEEVTVFIFKENHFASCYESFLSKTPANQALETLEDCILLVINRNAFEDLHKKIPKMHLVTRVVAEQRFINAQRIFTSHITLSPEERYLAFERQHGDLLLRVPQHIIASFLGVTPVSLSRIRNRIHRK